MSSQKIPYPVLRWLLKSFVGYHGARIAQADLRAPAPLEDECVAVLRWLWHDNQNLAIEVHTELLKRIGNRFKAAGAERSVQADYLVPRLQDGLRKLQLTSPDMPKGLAQGTAQASRRP